MNLPYVERDCVFEAQGHKAEAGGAALTEDYLIGYLGPQGELQTWHGKPLGRYVITATWETPTSYVSSTYNQVRATVQGRTYTGRSAGQGMIFKGRRIAKERNRP